MTADIHRDIHRLSPWISTGTLTGVTEPETYTKHRPIRVGKTRWDAFGLLVGPRSRAKVINEFIAWYVGEKGAKLPRPPKAKADVEG